MCIDSIVSPENRLAHKERPTDDRDDNTFSAFRPGGSVDFRLPVGTELIAR
jgi:hypothetical protein